MFQPPARAHAYPNGGREIVEGESIRLQSLPTCPRRDQLPSPPVGGLDTGQVSRELSNLYSFANLPEPVKVNG